MLTAHTTTGLPTEKVETLKGSIKTLQVVVAPLLVWISKILGSARSALQCYLKNKTNGWHHFQWNRQHFTKTAQWEMFIFLCGVLRLRVLLVSAWVPRECSDVLPRSNDTQVGLVCDPELPVGVNVSVYSCLFVSALRWTSSLSRMYPASRTMSAGKGSSPPSTLHRMRIG